MSFDSSRPLSSSFTDAISRELEGFMAAQRALLMGIGTELEPLLAQAEFLASGGKRLRPAFCYWAYVAASGQPAEPGPLLRAAASLDLLHTSALAHDDVMDDSDTRRGKPAAHRAFASLHRERSGRGSADAFGRAGAILLGDLLVVWSAEMFDRAGLDASSIAKALSLLHAVRTEVTCGQFLDILAESVPTASAQADPLGEANRVVEYKSARYSVQRPAQIGAALGGGDDALLSALARYGSPLGRAFQFRDDLLGIFGDEQLTGKPAGDDLREGKRTVLIAHALAGASPAAARDLDAMLGDRSLDEDQIERGRAIITESGAREAVERDIECGYQAAVAALSSSPMTSEGREALTVLADAAVRRKL